MGLITQHHDLGFRRNIVDFVPTSLPELTIQLRDLTHIQKSKTNLLFRNYEECKQLGFLHLDFGFQTFGADSREEILKDVESAKQNAKFLQPEGKQYETRKL